VTEVALRPATPDDEEFLRALYGTTRAEELSLTPWTDEQKAAFVAMQFHAQSTYYASVYPDATHDVVVVDGEDAGRLYLHRDDATVRVVDIAIAPAFRGRGVGTQLLQDVLATAGARTVVIHVEKQNRAKGLYERLGFAVVEEDPGGVYLRMECHPAP
jgi:ribosomal protein S18 acetylase RimI-like enzyme